MINSSKNAKQHANYLHHSTGRGRRPHSQTQSGYERRPIWRRAYDCDVTCR